MRKYKVLFILILLAMVTLLNGCFLEVRRLTDKENRDFDRQREREERNKEFPEPVLPE